MILVFIIAGLLFVIMGYGLYLTLGPGKKDLRDPIDEHAKMHMQCLVNWTKITHMMKNNDY